MTNRTSLFYKASYAVAFVIMVLGVYFGAYHNGLNSLQKTGVVRVEQFSDRLLGQLEEYKILPVLLASYPEILNALKGGSDLGKTNDFLLNAALLSGTEKIYVLNDQGIIIASSDSEVNPDAIGQNFSFRPDVATAQDGSLGFYHGRENTRGIYYTAAIFSDEGPPIGAVGLRVNVSQLEFEWHIDETPIAFFDANNVAFIANRTEVIMRQLSFENQGNGFTNYTADAVAPFFPHRKSTFGTHTIWRFQDDQNLPQSALVIERFIPQLKMTARAFVDTAPAKASARIMALLVAALLLLIWLRLKILAQKRQQLADRLESEEAANAQLEARVEDRTKQLRTAQHQLIQAGKLTALGQMAAGISHELNQPLAAMQNFAENGSKLIERGRQDAASENFGLIKNQVERMSRIIKGLRAFARKERETIQVIDLQSVISESLELSEARFQSENVKLSHTPTTGPILIMGGAVRMQQVFINVLNNAVDAMADQENKTIDLEVIRTQSTANIILRDNGPGFDDETRVFEPFYSTKEQGASKGMGLGLSISYGIVGSFGGDMTCRNHPDGGAEFTITLQLAEQKAAA